MTTKVCTTHKARRPSMEVFKHWTPQPSRARRSASISEQQWNEHKAFIKSLYINQKKTLNDLVRALEEIGFFPSRRQLVSQLSKWQLFKNAPRTFKKTNMSSTHRSRITFNLNPQSQRTLSSSQSLAKCQSQRASNISPNSAIPERFPVPAKASHQHPTRSTLAPNIGLQPLQGFQTNLHVTSSSARPNHEVHSAPGISRHPAVCQTCLSSAAITIPDLSIHQTQALASEHSGPIQFEPTSFTTGLVPTFTVHEPTQKDQLDADRVPEISYADRYQCPLGCSWYTEGIDSLQNDSWDWKAGYQSCLQYWNDFEQQNTSSYQRHLPVDVDHQHRNITQEQKLASPQIDTILMPASTNQVHNENDIDHADDVKHIQSRTLPKRFGFSGWA